MTTYTLPDGLKQASMNWGFTRKTVQNTSALSSFTQSVDLYSWRWAVDITFPNVARADSGLVEAFMNTLIGGVDRLALHRYDRPVPLGTMRGTPTLNAGVAQFSDTLVLAGAWDTSRRNLLLRSQEFDNASWVKAGTSSTPTISANATTAPDGTTTADKFVRAAVAGTNFLSQIPALTAGSTIAFSIYAKVADASQNQIRVALFNDALIVSCDAASGAISVVGGASVSVSSSSSGSGWWRFVIVAVVPGVSHHVRIYTKDNNSSSGTEGIFLWGAQLEVATAPTAYIVTTSAASYAPGTLNAGDMLGAGSQLFQMRTNATATSAGILTAKTVNRTRVALSSGAAVTWDRPTAVFAVQDESSSFGIRPGYMESSTFRLVEAPLA